MYIYLFIYMSGFTVVSDSLQSLQKVYFKNGDNNLVICILLYISCSIRQVQVIESRWTDKAYNYGL